MEVHEIVRKWYDLADGSDVDRNDIFFRFMALWVAFNALYTFRYGRMKNEDGRPIGDRRQVREFANERCIMEKHVRLLREDAEYRGAVQFLQRRGICDCATGYHLHINDEGNVYYVLMCVYQARCNLFHGGKMPDNPRDADVVKAGYAIVSRLMRGERTDYSRE